MSATARRRPYTTVAVAPAEAGFVVTLDGRVVATPARTPIAVPTRALAQAIAAEWEAQGARVEFARMPVTRICGTAIDRVEPRKAAVVEELVAYAATDLLCYRAADPAALVERQHREWQPLLDWVARTYDAPLTPVTGVIARDQPAASLAALGKALDRLDALPLSVLSLAVAAAGSLVIGLALKDGQIDAATAFALAELDATFQIEQWGEDEEATRRREALRAELALVASVFAALGAERV